MNTRTRFSLLLRASLGVLFVSLGLYSTAFADRNIAQADPVAHAAAAEPMLRAAPAPATSDTQQWNGQESTPAATLLGLPLPSDANQTQLTCGSGTVLTHCSCGDGCRPTNLSPQNFCRFYWCV